MSFGVFRSHIKRKYKWKVTTIKSRIEKWSEEKKSKRNSIQQQRQQCACTSMEDRDREAPERKKRKKFHETVNYFAWTTHLALCTNKFHCEMCAAFFSSQFFNASIVDSTTCNTCIVCYDNILWASRYIGWSHDSLVFCRCLKRFLRPSVRLHPIQCGQTNKHSCNEKKTWFMHTVNFFSPPNR